MINFDTRLNEIIHQHGIDSNYPWFYESIKAVKYIQEFWDEYKGSKVLILAEKAGDYENFRVLIPRHISAELVIYKNNSIYSLEESLEAIRQKEADDIILITYQDHVRVSTEFLRLQVKVIDIYDYFIEKGLNLYHEYYLINDEVAFGMQGNALEDTLDKSYYSVLFYDKRKYKLAKNKQIKFYYLEKVIFDYYLIRNFSDGEKYIKEYLAIRPEMTEKYTDFLEDVRKLLEKINYLIKQKKQKDIVLYWLDALTYGEDKKLPYLHSLDDECTVFNKAFTTIDTTGGAASAMFRQEMPAESRRFRYHEQISESNIFDFLEENGWDFKYYGMDGIFGDSKLSNVKKGHLNLIASNTYWNMLCDMAVDTKPAFRIAHNMEFHAPYLSGDMEGDKYIPTPDLFARSVKEVYGQRQHSMAYMDRQLAFFDKMIQTHATVYFSDHGCHYYVGDNIAMLHHIILKVRFGLLNKKIEDQVFSIINFYKLLQYLIIPDENPYHKIFSGYARLQSIPLYNKNNVRSAYRSKIYNEILVMGHNGIVKDNYVYFSGDYGKDYCYKLNDDKAYLMGYEKSKELRSQLRKELGESSYNINEDAKFKYSRLLVPVYGNAVKRTEPEKIRIACKKTCLKFMEEVPQNVDLAIRGGGEDTVMFLDCLSEQHRNKIKYIIDADNRCAASDWDIPVINPNEVNQLGQILIIIISSNYRVEMMKELQEYPDIMWKDIYDYLSLSGLDTRRTLADMLYGKKLLYEKEDFPEVDWDNI